MANSEYAYVRGFEQNLSLPLSNWIVVRIDGKGFSKFTTRYNFKKPNDERGIKLMNAAAEQVVKGIPDIIIAYGQSDEYSFVLDEGTTLFDRRTDKLATTIATAFTAEYCVQWKDFFPGTELERPLPTFDGRCVCYPKKRILRDYLSWRQVDCHINNLYNTTFWNLVLKDGKTTSEAEEALRGTFSKDKNEILFSRFGINYNKEPEMYKKGTVVYRSYDQDENALSTTEHSDLPANKVLSKKQLEKQRKSRQKASIVVEHVDIIGDEFWVSKPYILGGVSGGDSE